MKTVADQLADLKATREARQAELTKIAQKSIDENRSMDTAEAEAFDTAEGEIKSLDADIARLSRLAAVQAAAAKPVEKQTDGAMEFSGSTVQIKHTEKLEPGISFARYARCKALSYLEHINPAQVARSLYPHDEQLFSTLTKTAVPAANTGNNDWAGKLITDGAPFADFVEYLRPRTLLGAAQGMLRRIPFDVPVSVQSTGASAAWVGEGKAKPVTSWKYEQTILRPTKVANIAVATQEMIRRASADVDQLIRDELARALAARIDSDFLSPTNAGTANVKPASIFNGVAAESTSGQTGPDGVRCDVQTLMRAIIDTNNDLNNAFWIMSQGTAVTLSLMQNPLGQVAFPGVNMNGGSFFGMPVFITNAVPSASAGPLVALVNGGDIFFADNGGVEVSVSDQASLEMDTDPTHTSSSPSETTLVSLWQTNSVGFRVERTLGWKRRRAEAVAWMYADWDTCVS